MLQQVTMVSIEELVGGKHDRRFKDLFDFAVAEKELRSSESHAIRAQGYMSEVFILLMQVT